MVIHVQPLQLNQLKLKKINNCLSQDLDQSIQQAEEQQHIEQQQQQPRQFILQPQQTTILP